MHFIKKYWLGISSVLAVVISGLFLYDSFVGYYIHPSEGIARTTGRSIAYAFMAFFAANFMRKRWERKRLEFWIFCFAVSFSLCATYDLIKTNIQSCQLNNSKQEIARLGKVFDKSPSQKSLNEYSKEEYGDFSKIIPLIKHSFESSADMSAEINEAVANLADILTPANLSDHEKILKSKELIEIFADKLDHYKKRYFQEVNQRESDIKEAFSGNDRLKKQALIGFEEGKKKSNKLMNEYFQVENESVQIITDILDLVSEQSGHFWESDGMLFFENDDDADMFNQLIQNLNEHSKKEDIIINKLERHRQSVLQEMQNFGED